MSAEHTFEGIIDEIGGFGKFQIFTVLWIFSAFSLCSWSLMQMSFVGLVPDWYCESSERHLAESEFEQWIATNSSFTEDTFQTCTVNGSGCVNFRFLSPYYTVTEEWALVCSRKWVRAALISIQMGGMLVGALTAGQLSDQFGRRKVLNAFTLEHGVVNIAAAFASSWELFGIARFLIGVGIGGIITTAFPYGMEFLPLKWRPFTATFPFWGFGVMIFTGAAYLLPDWRHLHLALGSANIPCLIGYWMTPESIRWLIGKRKKEEVEALLQKIADTNGYTLPSYTAHLLEKTLQSPSAEGDKRASYVDLFRSRFMIKCTAVMCFFWFTMSLVVYGISFAVTSLAGNIYVNMLLMAVIEVPGLPLNFWLMNRLGRRKAAVMYFGLATAAALTVLCLIVTGSVGVKGAATRWVSLAIRMLNSYAWSVVQTWGAELYPTVTRNISYGAANTSARVGGMLAPFIIDLESGAVQTYVIITVMTFLMTLAPFTLPETNGEVLHDHLPSPSERGEKQPVKLIVMKNTSDLELHL